MENVDSFGGVPCIVVRCLVESQGGSCLTGMALEAGA